MLKDLSIVWRLGMTVVGLLVAMAAAGCAPGTSGHAQAHAQREPPAAAAPNSGAEMNAKRETGVSVAKFHAIRLLPGDDLRAQLTGYVQSHGLRAAAIVSAVGSLQEASLRMADESRPTKLVGKYEIVSLSGTFSPDGPHLHIAISDHEGRTIGGHVLDGCIVYTTAEVVIAELTDLRFSRETDARTGYHELQIGRAGEGKPIGWPKSSDLRD
jgi:predicted DNA-binding protein with PD1-like motif